ncbi:hypothetical protein IFM89_008783 [Coptis chinensis]|uniref:Uncharacterized protein n=1 Tax=Coptis chinensis TaxID=261450 RepID=A0A835LAP0_9MAGN|nr:hypothetical protein IFM89_008783 [Coptis chinensis]
MSLIGDCSDLQIVLPNCMLVTIDHHGRLTMRPDQKLELGSLLSLRDQLWQFESGKAPLVDSWRNNLDYFRISTGQVLRAELESGSKYSNMTEGKMASGVLLP